MTLGMRIRLWARQAPRLQVVGAALTAVTVMVAFVVAAVPDDTTQTVAAGSNSPLYPGLATTPESGAGATGTTAPAAGGAAAPATGPSTGAIGVPGGAAPSTAGARPANSPGATTPTSGPLARPGTVPSGGGSSAGPTGAPAPGGPTPGVTATTGPVARTASDQGVTPDTIKVGFLLVSFANLDAAGFAFGQRQDREAAIKAYVDDVNKRGGIHGRKVVYTIVKSDPFNAAANRQACIKLTTDEKVFAVLNGGGAVGSNVACYAD